ncbi:MAG: ABC transporter permease subunit [Rubricoccaceae bacterium]|nr:ABC transporter permease subunit [Rubricoccaceae bacterium]
MKTAHFTPANRLFTYELRDVVRSRWAVVYTLFFLIITDAFFRFSGGGEQVILSLVNVVLILIPLVCLMFGVSYLYNAREFIELMLAQPVRRRDFFIALYSGLLAPLAVAFVLGTFLPFLWHGAIIDHGASLLRLLIAGVFLTAIFLALAFLLAVRFDDRVKGLGIAILLWVFLAILFDGLVLLVAHSFSNYPLETPMLIVTSLNPISLARVLLLLSVDVAALLGYTGAAFERMFGSAMGTFLALSSLVAWVVVPLVLAYRKFSTKDF